MRIPRYTATERLRSRGRQGIELRVNPAAFGAEVGKGLTAIGGSLGRAADAMIEREKVVAANDAHEAEQMYRDARRDALLNPDYGYMNKTGANAVDGSRESTKANLQDLRSQIEADLSPMARKAFSRTADGLDNAANTTMIRHEGAEFKQYTMDTFSASAEGYLQEAAMHAQDDAMFSQNVQAAEVKLRQAAALAGKPPEQVELDVQQLRQGAQASRVLEFARKDPVKAYEYLQENKDSLDGATYDKLHAGLEKTYYAHRARGVVDSYGGVQGESASVPTGDWLRYRNQGATRNQRLSRKLTTAMSVLPELGLGFEVTSGGQPDAEEATASGAGRVGSTRHDHGHAADGYFTKNGKRLSWANPGERAIISEAIVALKKAGITGVGAGPGYMAEGMVHIGFGREAVWGDGGSGANAPQWLIDTWNNGEVPADVPQSTVGMTMADAMRIEDPKLRAATMSEIELRRAAFAQDREERKRRASEQAWDIVDNGGRPEDIPPELQAEVGLQTMNTIFDSYTRNQTGVDTNDEIVEQELRDMMVDDLEQFLSVDLNEERDVLSRAVYADLKEQQRQMRKTLEVQASPEGQAEAAMIYSPAELRAEVSDAEGEFLQAVGRTKMSDLNKEEHAKFQTFSREYKSRLAEFTQDNRRKMTVQERNALVSALMMPVVLSDDPGASLLSGVVGNPDRYAFEARETFQSGTIEPELERTDIMFDDYQRIKLDMEARFGPGKVTDDDIVEQYENEMLMSLGIQPNIIYDDISPELRKVISEEFPGMSREETIEVFKRMALDTARENARRTLGN